MTQRFAPAGKLATGLWLVAVVFAPCSYAGESTGDEQSNQAGGFRYSDDWKIVSAPPPPGPYNTVNVDPRVPGQDITRPVPRDLMLTEPSDRMPDELGQVPPPSAGVPARSAESRPLHSVPAYTTPPPAGAYGRQNYGRYSAPGYSTPGYTEYYQQTYPGYGQRYGQGYNPGYQNYGYSYPGQYAPYRQQDIPPPSYAVTPGR